MRYAIEYGLVVLFYYSCRLTSLARSSAWAGAFCRWLGPKLKISQVAYRNLTLAMPDLSDAQKKAIIKGMWENLGRTFGEYPHLRDLDIFAKNTPITIEGKENLTHAQKQNRPILFFLGHLANWEYATMPAKAWGSPATQLFRPLNNPPLARFITKVHQEIAPDLVTKGQQGARQMIGVLKSGKNLSMLIDQKLNEGIAVPFFGYPAMTPAAIAKLALKFKGIIIPVQVIRTQASHYCKVIYHPPIQTDYDLNEKDKVLAMMTDINYHLETWIRQHPQDWLWLHKRWPQSY